MRMSRLALYGPISAQTVIFTIDRYIHGGRPTQAERRCELKSLTRRDTGRRSHSIGASQTRYLWTYHPLATVTVPQLY